MNYRWLILFLGILSILTGFLINSNRDVSIKRHNIDKNNNYTNQKTINQISLSHIFSKDHNLIANLNNRQKITLIVTGDVIPARMVNYTTSSNNDFLWPFKKTADTLKAADITFINLEAPLTKNCPVTTQGMIFCGSTKHIEGLLSAGVDLVNLANNHAGNYGIEGIKQTIELLSANQITVTGNNQPTIINIKGVTFGFLGYNLIGHKEEGIGWVDKEQIKADLILLKKQAEVAIVAYHWGNEYVFKPEPNQIELAHFTIDNGADVIVGNHPHWVKPIELYQNKLIIYGLGNFVFDQMWSEETKEGVIGKLTFFGKELADVEFVPIKIENYGQPRFLEGKEREDILNKMKQGSL